jgi:hypothetical protein
LAVGGDVLVVATGESPRLPNAVALGTAKDTRPFDSMRSGDPVAVGGRTVVAPGLHVTVVRWWDPHPKLAPTTPGAVLERVAGARSLVAPRPDFGLGTSLTAADPEGVAVAAMQLVGRGSGLTPEGDDLLTAALAAYRLIGRAVGRTSASEFVDRVSGDLLAVAADRTTSLSASLLRHACRGHVADPVGRFLLALGDRGDVAAAAAVLLGVGHSSGPALASGVLIGAAAACGEELR